MACVVDRDQHGSLFTVPADNSVKTPRGKTLRGVPEITAWWTRDFKARAEETLTIRQENLADRADVVEVTFGQLYDLIDALNKAVENA